MQCSNCQATIAAGVKFCPKCGTPAAAFPAHTTVKRCPQCGTENPVNAKFCKKDGYQFAGAVDKPDTTAAPAASAPAGDASICPQCGTSNSSTAKFCKKDGYSLQGTGAVTPPPSTGPGTKSGDGETGISPPVAPEVPQSTPTKQSVPVLPRPLASTAPSGNAPINGAGAKSNKRLAIGMALGLALLASAAAGYYFFTETSAPSEKDALQTAPSAEPVAPVSSVVLESVTPASSEATSIGGVPSDDNINGPVAEKSKQIPPNGESVRQPTTKPQVDLPPPATATRAPEKPKDVRELLIGRWQMTGGITEFRPDGSSQGYRGDGSPLNSGWWRLEDDRLTIGWMRNGGRREVGCTVLSVNEREFLCKDERKIQRATRLPNENLPQRPVDQQSKPNEQDKGGRVTTSIRQFINRELEKAKQCEGKWGTTPECPASSWDQD